MSISFVYGWELALVLMSGFPFLCGSFSIVANFFATMTIKERLAYAKAGGVAEEVISAIKTVTAFGGQEKEAQRYLKNLTEAKDFGVKKSLVSGVGLGLAWCIMFCNWALGFWYGGMLVRHGDYEVKDMMTVFFASLIAYVSVGLASTSVKTISTGLSSAYNVYVVLDREPQIDGASRVGLKPASLTGTIRFKKVHFNYPSRPSVKVLRGLDLIVKPGQTVALVGPSGCGKSTVMQLLLRFYDPDQGEVCIDGVDVRDINIRWLRQHLGMVSQEPVLFATSISENIRYGREDATMEEIIEAAKKANAFDFIMKMPNKFDTHVGERGAQLSGGQKQRLAIARALVKNPKILLLDEATSALDAESEAVVQIALDKAREGRTTLLIAHRLSTVRNADVIVTFEKGRVAEQGTHDELMAKKGIYYHLASEQVTCEPPTDEGTTDSESDGTFYKDVAERKKKMAQKLADHNSNILVHESEEAPEVYPVLQEPVIRLLKMNAPEWYCILIGCVAGFINGAVQPAWGIVFAEVTRGWNFVQICLDPTQSMLWALNPYNLTSFTKDYLLCFHSRCSPLQALSEDTDSEQKDTIRDCCIYSVCIAVVSFFAYLGQEYMFGLSGEALTMRVRDLLFRSIIGQNMAFFDDKRHETGALSLQLSEDASVVQGTLKTLVGCAFLTLGNLGVGLVISLIYSWQLALALVGFVPVLVVSGMLTVKYISGAANENKIAMEDASKNAMASIDNVKTVASLTLEDTLYNQFSQSLWGPYKTNIKNSLRASFAFGVSQGVYYLTFSVCFYYGAQLLEDDDIDYYDIFKVFTCIVMGAMQLGRSVAFAPDASRARRAAGRIFGLADYQTSINPYSDDGEKPAEGSFSSVVRFSHAQFRYPTRPEVTILNGLDLSVQPGQTLALVGESGCGKSTAIHLMERFYDLEAGTVFLDKHNVKELNVQWLRRQIGLVSQEPILFDTSIEENIAYGDNSRKVSMDEIIRAAREANIHNFIEALPQGYNTNVGSKGTQLSGGQKQRIAIARALVRNPKILLLDEATSALDTDSEKIVQEALDKARAGRTCITIAHRLSTIKDADKIAVIEAGRVMEQGNHHQLMALKGLYYRLRSTQSKK
ncbi:ATP-dependent translocase ABCB1 [Aplysia californica]|uniref:ATP-dependent translocase ABCB1 n=1 Tax=Aplysia californica TaxID=6500 RepID=A0ABM1VRT0_APLCA|nr:ATP-dependent translocase ABCB1 [Aplysia californica]